jgi:Mlc titration factor MtfA (ptsG expression regulator)
MFGFFKRRRRRRLLEQSFPAAWQKILHDDVRLYRTLSREEKNRLRDDLRIFIAEHRWETSRGFELTEQMQVVVAANACLLTLGHATPTCLRVSSILLVPSSYEMPGHRMGGGRIVSEGFMAFGHTSMHGPVVLAWKHVLRESRTEHDGHNVVLHEFAHRLDMCDGLSDGVPPAAHRDQEQRWQQVLTREFKRLQFERSMGMNDVLRDYGATDPVEFFAVSTEVFFEKPVRLQQEHPDLYDVLREYYQQDPASRDPIA